MTMQPYNELAGKRCSHFSIDGKQCRQDSLKDYRYCLYHMKREEDDRSADHLADSIIGEFEPLDSAFAINRALSRVFRLTAERKLPLRTSTLLAYIGQHLVLTLPYLERDRARGLAPDLRRYDPPRELRVLLKGLLPYLTGPVHGEVEAVLNSTETATEPEPVAAPVPAAQPPAAEPATEPDSPPVATPEPQLVSGN
jgi:hypothetical protein